MSSKMGPEKSKTPLKPVSVGATGWSRTGLSVKRESTLLGWSRELGCRKSSSSLSVSKYFGAAGPFLLGQTTDLPRASGVGTADWKQSFYVSPGLEGKTEGLGRHCVF